MPTAVSFLILIQFLYHLSVPVSLFWTKEQKYFVNHLIWVLKLVCSLFNMELECVTQKTCTCFYMRVDYVKQSRNIRTSNFLSYSFFKNITPPSANPTLQRPRLDNTFVLMYFIMHNDRKRLKIVDGVALYFKRLESYIIPV